MAAAPTAAPAAGAATTNATTPTSRRKLPAASSGADSDSASASAPAATSRRPVPSDPLSTQATTALIRRVLCPKEQSENKTRDAQKPLEQLLPPLTSRNDVDLELYAFLAIIMRDFVQSWYSRITTDETFVAEIVHVIAHCTRTLEQRFRRVDMESLLFDEIPDLLQKHINDYRVAHRSLPTSPLTVEPREVYHSLCPLPHLSPVPRSNDPDVVDQQKKNEAAYRQLLVQSVLAVLLPTEDLENPCLTSLVGQIFSELIIGNVVANKAAQPWMLFEGLCIIARVLGEKKAAARARLVGGGQLGPDGKPARRFTAHGFFLSIINAVLFFITAVRLVASAVMVPSSLPPRFPLAEGHALDQLGKHYDHDDDHERELKPPTRASSTNRVPILEFSVWSCVSSLAELPSRMPWLSGFMAFMQHAAMHGPGHFGRLDGTLDRFLSHRVQSMLHSSHIPPLLRTLRGLLFPNNSPGKPSLFPPSSESELLALRRRAASALLGLVPDPIGRLYLSGRPPLVGSGRGRGDGGEGRGEGEGEGESNHDGDGDHEQMVDEVEQLLMVVSDEYCNKHLIYGILELILVRLMPEMAEKGVEELWDERLG